MGVARSSHSKGSRGPSRRAHHGAPASNGSSNGRALVFTIPSDVAAKARDSLPGALHAAQALPAGKATELLAAAKAAFTDGLAIASGVGAALLLTAAVAVWLLLRPRQSPGAAEISVLTDPGVHGDPGGDRRVDAAGRAELGDRHR